MVFFCSFIASESVVEVVDGEPQVEQQDLFGPLFGQATVAVRGPLYSGMIEQDN